MKTGEILAILLLLCLALTGINACSESDEKPSVRTDITDIAFQTGSLSQQVTFTTDAAWTAETAENWLKVAPTRGEAGNITLTLIATPNGQPDARSAMLRIKAGETVREIPVMQVKKGTLIVSQKVYNNLTSEGSTILVTLQNNLDYTARIVEGETWIRSNGSKALISKEWKFIVDPNGKAGTRTGKIVFKDRNSTMSDTVTINQTGNPDAGINIPVPAFRSYSPENFDKTKSAD